jgi:hypothetical protein
MRSAPNAIHIASAKEQIALKIRREELTPCPSVRRREWSEGLFQIIHSIHLLLCLIELQTHSYASRRNVFE